LSRSLSRFRNLIERTLRFNGFFPNYYVNRLYFFHLSTVINCAASVKHFADMDFLKRTNVEGVRNLAELCIKKGARLIHVSTNSVAGSLTGGSGDAVLRENTLNVGQEVESNGYIYTKYLAEELILKKIREDGLDAKIMRVGNLMSRYNDGDSMCITQITWKWY
jgi:thioester reductase-like protein